MRKQFDLTTGQEKQDSQRPVGSYQIPESVKLSEELLTSYEAARSEWALQAKEDQMFRDGAQWTQKQINYLKARKQSPIVVNVIKPAVEQAKALLTANKPRFTSTSKEDSDVRTGALFGEILSHIWYISEGDVQHKLVIDDYYVKGLGCWFAYYDPNKDYGKGEVCIHSLDPFDVFVDPNAKDIFFRDAAHIIVARQLTSEQLQRTIPGILPLLERAHESEATRHPVSTRVGIEKQDTIETVTEELHRKYEAIDRYSRVKIPYVHALVLSTSEEKVLTSVEFDEWRAQPAMIEEGSQGRKVTTDPMEVEALAGLFKETGGVYHYVQDPTSGTPRMVGGPESEGAIPGSQVVMSLVTVDQLIQIGEIETNGYSEDRILRVFSVGGVLVWEGVLPISNYPIVPVPNHFTRNPYPMSDVRFTRGIQEYINKVRSLIITHAANSANVKVLLPEGSVNKREFEKEFGKAGTAVLTFNAEAGHPVIAAPIPLPSELYKNEAQARQDVEQIFGIYALAQGDPYAAPDTYKGTVALDEYGQRRIKSKLADIEGSLNQLAKVLVELVQAYYTERKVIRLFEPNNVPKQIELNTLEYNSFGDAIGKINDVTVGQYDVVVVSGSMLPSNRWARFEYYMSLYQAGLIDQLEVLKQTEVVDIEGVLERFGQIQLLQQQLNAAVEEIKKLQGDLQTAERESTHDRKRVEVEKFKSSLSELKNKAKASVTIFDQRLRDEEAARQPAAEA